MTLCPYCEQDDAVLCTIRATGEQFLVCPECEWLWAPDAAVRKPGLSRLWTVLEGRGLPTLWSELDRGAAT